MLVLTRSRAAVAGVAAALLLPAAADASVQAGTLTDPAGDQAIAGLDLTSLSVRHDTAGSTTVSIQLAAPPPATPVSNIAAAVGTLAGGDCVPPQIGFLAQSDGTTATGQPAPGGTSIPVTRTFDAATNTITLTTPHAIPGGAEAGCAYVFLRQAGGTAPFYDQSALLRLEPETPAPTPTPTPTPSPAPTPEPVPGPPASSPALGALGKLGGRSVIYGLCGPSICRLDARGGRSVKVRKATKATAYTAVSTSARGSVMAYARGGKVFRAGRDGRKPADWGAGTFPVIRADGRAVAWGALRTFPNPPRCYTVPFSGVLTCDYLTGSTTAPVVLYRSDGDAESRTYTRGPTDYGWAGAMLLTTRERDGTNAGYICAGAPDGRCVRPLAQDAAASLAQAQSSPDGRLLVAVSEPVPATPQTARRGTGSLVLYDARTGGRLRTLTTGTRDARPVFSPDGKQVAFNRGSDLYVIAARGGKAKRLARGVKLTGPSWSLAG